MILPIVSYGNRILKQESEEIDENYEGLEELISNMWETLYATEGVGLAAPQVNKSIRLFVIDAKHVIDGYKKVFINPIIEEYYGEDIEMREGCLSLPGLSEIVKRKSGLRISYYDENWEYYEDEYKSDDNENNALIARMIQHEYDHIEGILYIDRISNFRKQLLKSKLERIRKGNIYPPYDMIFPKK
jgi:peptide deformylase